LLQQLCSHRAGNVNSNGLYHDAIFSSQLSLLDVRSGVRSTSVRARLDPTEGSPALLTFLCWILSERQSLVMCNNLIQQIRYRSALMHFPVHLKISWELKVIELATIECSPWEQQNLSKFEIPHSWSASTWLKLLNVWNSAVGAILTTSYILVVSRSHCPNTQAIS
jgi:hypothetical protein